MDPITFWFLQRTGSKPTLMCLALSWSLKMGPIGSSETSVSHYYYTMRNSPEERSSHVHSGRRLKSWWSMQSNTLIWTIFGQAVCGWHSRAQPCYKQCHVIWLLQFQTVMSSSEHILKASFYKGLLPWLGTGLLTSSGKWIQPNTLCSLKQTCRYKRFQIYEQFTRLM